MRALRSLLLVLLVAFASCGGKTEHVVTCEDVCSRGCAAVPGGKSDCLSKCPGFRPTPPCEDEGQSFLDCSYAAGRCLYGCDAQYDAWGACLRAATDGSTTD